MSKEKQIEEMAEEISDVWNNKCQFVTCKGCKYSGLNDDKCQEKLIADHLIAKGYRKQSEWISVEERLPEGQGYYIGYTYKGLMMIAPFFPYYVNDKPEFRYDITHWMPLPEAPKNEN